MRELEATLQQFGEFILRAGLVEDKAAPYCVGWVRRFLTRPASDEPLADQCVQRAIQELAGHQELGTTQRYMHLSLAALDAAIRLLEPHAGPV